jgi:hypothetical protein
LNGIAELFTIELVMLTEVADSIRKPAPYEKVLFDTSKDVIITLAAADSLIRADVVAIVPVPCVFVAVKLVISMIEIEGM